MDDLLGPYRDQRGLGREPHKQVRFVGAGKEHEPAALDEPGEVAMFEGGAKQAQVGFEDTEDGFLPGTVKEGFNVIAEPEAKHVKEDVGFGVDRAGKLRGFVDRLVTTVEAHRAAVGRGQRHGGVAGLGLLDRVAFLRMSRFDRNGEIGIDGPQRRHILQIRGVVGEDVSRRVIENSLHGSRDECVRPKGIT